MTWNRQIMQEDEKFAGRGMLKADWNTTHYQATDETSGNWVETTGQRFVPSNPSEIVTGNRHGFRRKAKFEVHFDKMDAQFLSNLGLPTSQVQMDARAKLKALRDQWFIDAAVATAKAGPVTAMVDVPFPTQNIIPVNFVLSGSPANNGMTPHKLLEVTKRFKKGHIDPNEAGLKLAMDPKQELDLFIYGETYSNDTFAKAVVAWLNGETDRLFGSRWEKIITNSLPLNTSTDIRTCVAFSDRAFGLSPQGMDIKFDTVRELGHAQQITMYADSGVFREKDEYVHLIYCDESP